MLRGLAFLLCAPVWAAPCTTAEARCSEWVTPGGGPARTLVYRTHPLDRKDERITRALVMIHGQARNAGDYFRTAVAAAFLAGALEDTVVVAPRFASNNGSACVDKLAQDEVNWRCAGDSWRSGAPAIGNARLTSYELADEVLRRLASKEVFPNLKVIVITGHSAGGQFVTRYAMAGLVHENLGVAVRYVVSNPSSYAYPDAARPAATGGGFGAYRDARNCTAYDRWPFGLERRSGYAARLSAEQLRTQLASRPVTYLLGELDTLPLAGFDESCPAMAQGPNRLERGRAFHAYVNRKYGARHELAVAPMCGHNARCIYTSDAALPLLFPGRE